MRSLIKAIVRKFLFSNHTPRTFVPSKLSVHDIAESVFLVTERSETDITWEHCIVCHEPFQIALCTTPVSQDVLHFSSARVEIRRNNAVSAEVTVQLKSKFEVPGNLVLVCEIKKARCHQLGYWQQYILLKRYFLNKKRDTFLQGMIYGVLYSFPRKVVVASYKDDAYFNIFPMDFQCWVEKANLIILGLRTTNTTLRRILASGMVVISDTSSTDLKTIYDLGRNHSSSPPSIDQLPFGVSHSEQFGFYVPDFSASYREFKIVKSFELGSHTMMIGSQVNAKAINENNSFIHHVHFFEFVASGYTPAR
jgi:flavin reductase (DIM6/NTAB) family NADH-FMN oxidoreductase RutF